jgi:hypothetical protein
LYVVTGCHFAPEPFIAATLPCQRVRSRARHDAERGPALVVVDPWRGPKCSVRPLVSRFELPGRPGRS